jgi:hypothetical protein
LSISGATGHGFGEPRVGDDRPDETVRALLDARAHVNYVVKKGMTPLLYAASIDFGDSSVLGLQASGEHARRTARIEVARPGGP